MRIYNKIILEWNGETQLYDTVVYEDSYEYDGELMLMFPDDDDGSGEGSGEGSGDGSGWGEGEGYVRCTRMVQAGDQCWMQKNLRVTHYQDGSEIPTGFTGDGWADIYSSNDPRADGMDTYGDWNSTDGYLPVDESHIETYGHLYNYYAVDARSGIWWGGLRGLCPEGWHVPNNTEWQILVDYLGGENVASGKLKESNYEHWDSPNTGATDEIGFTAVPGGRRVVYGTAGSGYWSMYQDLGLAGCYWTAVDGFDGGYHPYAYAWLMSYNSSIIHSIYDSKVDGMSVRCVADEPNCDDVTPWFWGAEDVSVDDCEEGDPCEITLYVYDDRCQYAQQSLSFSFVLSSVPASGTVEGMGDSYCAPGSLGVAHTVWYETDLNTSGTDSFTYEVLDPSSVPGCKTNAATVNINVTGTADYDFSDCTEHIYNIAEGSFGNEITISCTAPEDEAVTSYDVGPTSNGTLYDLDENEITDIITIYGASAELIYNAHSDETDNDHFQYVAASNDGSISEIQTAQIHINEVQDAPECYGVSYTGDENDSLSVTLDCSDGGSGFSEDEISYWKVDNLIQTYGTITGCDTADECGENITFQPNLNWNGDTSFTYTACTVDRTCGNWATASITIDPINTPPEASDLEVTVRFITYTNDLNWPIIFHKTGVDTTSYSDWLSNPDAGCGDGTWYDTPSGDYRYDMCIYDPDPYENNAWFNNVPGADECVQVDGVSTCPGGAEFTYLAIQVQYDGSEDIITEEYCEFNTGPPLKYIGQDDTTYVEDNNIYPYNDFDSVPYFSDGVSNLELWFNCSGITDATPFTWSFEYKVIECMYYGSDEVFYWGEPYCADEESGPTNNPLKSTDWYKVTINAYQEGYIYPEFEFDYLGTSEVGYYDYQFINKSVDGGSNQPITSYYWCFDWVDGACQTQTDEYGNEIEMTSTEEHPTFTYTTTGYHNVALGINIIAGCTDSAASNYNPGANIDDGSCEYGEGGELSRRKDKRDVRKFQGGGETSIAVSHIAGWNIVSLPVEVEDSSLPAVYPDATEGTLYSYNEVYIGEEALEPGKGYWLHFPEAGTTTIAGTPITSLTISLNGSVNNMSGWNFFSGISEVTNVSGISDPGGVIVAGTVYGFSGVYVSAFELTPGHGYWISASTDGDITIFFDDDIEDDECGAPGFPCWIEKGFTIEL